MDETNALPTSTGAVRLFRIVWVWETFNVIVGGTASTAEDTLAATDVSMPAAMSSSSIQIANVARIARESPSPISVKRSKSTFTVAWTTPRPSMLTADTHWTRS
jgi:hypothetical protein